MTRKGFTLLAMRFTGDKALQFQVAYVDAFERMEDQLRRSPAYSIPTSFGEALRLPQPAPPDAPPRRADFGHGKHSDNLSEWLRRRAAFGDGTHRMSTLRHTPSSDEGGEQAGTALISTLGGSQRRLIVAESGLYKLIMQSDKPVARSKVTNGILSFPSRGVIFLTAKA